MAIVKNSCRVSRLYGDFSHGTASTEDENESSLSLSAGDGVSEDGASDADSGMASDEFDLSEFGDSGTELCQVGNQSFALPLDLYDLPDLSMVLSVETWNECLTEEERFALAEYLPDMDPENFCITLKELFSGSNFHFGSPLELIFNQLKGGLCDPVVVLQRKGLNILQRTKHHHKLCQYQNSMVESIVKIKDAWKNCDGYGIEERMRHLNILRNQKSWGYGKNGDLGFETASGSSESVDQYLNRRFHKEHGALRPSKKPSFNALTSGSGIAAEQPVRLVKEKAKGILKVAAPKISAKKESLRIPRFDLDTMGRRGTDYNYLEDQQFGSDRNAAPRTTVAKSGSLKSRRHDLIKGSAYDMQSHFGEEVPDEFVTSSYFNQRKNTDLAVTVAAYDSYDYDALNGRKKLKHNEGRKHPTEELPRRSSVRPFDANQSYIPKRPNHKIGFSHSSDINQSHLHANVYGESLSLDHPGTFPDSIIRGHKGKIKGDFISGKSYLCLDSKGSSCKAASLEKSGLGISSDHRTKSLQDQRRRKADYHDGSGLEYSRISPVYAQSEETQSDSSGQLEDGRDMYPFANRPVHPTPTVDVCQSGVKLENDYKMSRKLAKPTKNGSHPPSSGTLYQTPELEAYTKKTKNKGKESGLNYLDDDKFSRKEHVTRGSFAADRKRKGTSDVRYPLEQANGTTCGISDEADMINTRLIAMENRSQIFTDYIMENDSNERTSILLPKKKKGKGGDEFLVLDESIQHYSSPMRQVEDYSARKKKGKRKADVVVNSSVVIPEPMVPDKVVLEVEIDRNMQKKSFTLITPTIHTGFSFSVIHLLSAVRKALITAQLEDTEEIGNQKKIINNSNGGMFLSQSLNHLEGSNNGGLQSSIPALSVQEIVHRVKSNPGDPCILETSEPLQDLVRGVLKIFSSKTAPLGAKGWKTLVTYEKSIKSWSWVGPVPSNLSDNDNTEEETSAEAWGIPHKMLVKLVDAFANWLKSGQDTLQQIGTLPAPPAVLPVMDYKDRFRDLRAQKSLNTIGPSSEELRAYFHREEMLRYSIPDRAFQYTAVDGRKSIVAPLRRGGGKPTSKARDHYMLKTDRPPHVTVLCLVRDAAARLPGSIGTRADVCTLIRDSQYIVEDVTDAQVNQVVSGALDRLHYERDPCVQFDGERKLWVYLHQDREEEDFEDDGTSSTKKWKRQRKDPADPPEVEPINESNYLAIEPAAGGASSCDFNPDLNIASSEAIMDDKGELVYNDLRPNRENVQSYVSPAICDRGQSNSIRWGFIGGNPLLETKMLCQENSTNQDFDDESFSRERSVGLLSASLF